MERVTVDHAGRRRSAEHGNMSRVALAAMVLGEMVRAELDAGGSPPEAVAARPTAA